MLHFASRSQSSTSSSEPSSPDLPIPKSHPALHGLQTSRRRPSLLQPLSLQQLQHTPSLQSQPSLQSLQSTESDLSCATSAVHTTHNHNQLIGSNPSTATANVQSKKRFVSLREHLVDRAATLFPSMLILTFSLLIILHILNPSTMEILTHATGTATVSGATPGIVHQVIPSHASRSQYLQPHQRPQQQTYTPSSLFFPNLPSLSSSSRKATNKRLSHEDLLEELKRWRDPGYASSRLRVYFYDLPAEFNIDLVSRSHANPPKIRDPYCDESFYSAEHTISEHFRTSAIRTLDPKTADFFYVPIYTTCYLLTHLPNDVNRTGAFFARAMDHVMQEYPYWNRSDGRDHVFMFAQGFGARLSGEWQRYRHATFLVHNGDYSETHFSVHKDIVVPPDLSHYLTPVGLSSPDKLVTKKHFVLFGGQVLNASISDHRGSNYSGGVRQYVTAHLAQADGYRITGVRSTSYTDDMAHSVFCLAPHGWHKWSPRPAYAVLLGCIPVVISEEQALFLENMLDYRAFSYWVRPSAVHDLDHKLRSVRTRALVARERQMRLIWPLFWYDPKQGLAREAIMYSLYRKIGAVKSVRHFL